MELYQDTLLDLLNPGARDGTKLLIKRDQKGAVFVEGSETRAAGSAEDLSAAFTQGLEGRKVAATKMNSESSRSHLIFTIFLEVTNATVGTRASSKVTFVDLAGSERVARSGAINDKDRLDEARAINKSLSALGDVVAALTAGESFVPYRNHKLTQLMSDSLGGNAKTLMIVNVSPVEDDAPETKNSLEYANRVKQVKNENSRSFETREIQKLKAEIAKLKSRKASPQ
uniref:Kinesin-like calmodulin binding protein n=1 Tax=Tetraselmis sp. GSL018 TaxID=582737 RepID=A0A061SI43_9CHLO